MESNLICKNEESSPKMMDLNFEPKSFCSCIKEKSFNFTLEDLEDKRWQLINLQRVIVGLRQLQYKKRMTDAKQMKLAMKSKGRFIYPDIIITSEMSKSAAYENELVKNELNCFSGNNIKENFQDKFQECESKARRFFKTSEETLYKIFEIRIGHLVGANTCAFAIISSDALYVVEENFHTKLDEVLHENVDLILVGESERWVAILSKDSYSNTVGNERKREASFIQLDTGDSFLTRNIIKYLEMAIRRRLIALSIIIKKPDCQVRNGKLSVDSVCAVSLAHPSFASRRIRFSYGRWLEPLLPSVIPWSKQEVYYIENWLMEKLKIKKRPRVLACWLVFWENGSEFLCEKETQTCPSPCLDGYLMVNSSWYNTWTPAYFYLKGGMLYRFNDSCDKLPHTVYKIKDFCGCRRLSSHARPHSFELLKLDGYSIALAAPNEDTASQWLQCFLKIIGTSDDYNWEECVKLKPCQVIQTTESLILSYQENSKAILSLKDDVESILPMKKDFKKRSVNLSSSQDQKTKNNLRRMFSNGKLIPKLPSSNQAHVSSSVPNQVTETSADLYFECPPTPPLPEFPVRPPECTVNENQGTDRCQIDLKLLSFCNIDQISNIIITSWPTNGCLMEFECSEASEIAGDWVLYFSSENQLSSFLTSVLELREAMTEKENRNGSLPFQELIGPTKVTSGRVHDLLVEGTATSQNYWKPFSNRLH